MPSPSAWHNALALADDWRLTCTIENADSGLVGRLTRSLHEHEVEGELRERLGGRVAVSGGYDHVFLYADTEAALAEAETIARALLAQQGLQARIERARWHEVEERWEDPSVPLPETAAERGAERARLEAQESAESGQDGPLWEVRVELPSHGAAVDFSQRLEDEGYAVTRRWRFLLVGASTEDEAKALAERLRTEAPAGATVHPEPSSTAAWAWQAERLRPFAVFGGLGM